MTRFVGAIDQGLAWLARTLEQIARHPDILTMEGQTRTITYLVCKIGAQREL